MNTIQVFQSEINDGVAEAVKSQASVAYCSSVAVADKPAVTPEIKVLAENKDQFDLYYLESVLVSTGWNKNDDVFVPEATWAARKTPEDKQFNFMHDENDIIGHITSCYVVDNNGNTISDSIETAPEQFDIITRAVIYNSWTEAKNVNRMDTILAEIADGKWFVSMECLFAGFDYALTNASGETRLLARNEETSFLTKHLRSYGGKGEYEGWKLGRSLKAISFSGKGLVSNPANPRSVILNQKSKSFVLNNRGFSIGELTMSDDKVLQSQIDELKASLAEAKAEAEAAKQAVIEAKDKEYAAKISKFEDTVAALTEEIGVLKAADAEAQTAFETVNVALSETKEALEASKAELKVIAEREKKADRFAQLVQAGCDDETAEANVEAFASLDDNAFKAVVATFNKFEKKGKKDDKKDESEASDEKEDEADASEVFDDVESSEASLVIENQDVAEELMATRKSMASWIESSVLKSTVVAQ